MLSPAYYSALLPYRESPSIPVPPSGLTSIEQELHLQKLIAPAQLSYQRSESLKALSIRATSYRITQKGLDALEEYERMRREKRNMLFLQIALAILAALLPYLFSLFFSPS